MNYFFTAASLEQLSKSRLVVRDRLFNKASGIAD